MRKYERIRPEDLREPPRSADRASGESQPPAPASRDWRGPLRAALGAVLLLWALFITYLLLAPAHWAFGVAPWLRPAGHFAVLLGVWRNLFGPDSWNWLVTGGTWGDLAIGAAGLGAMTLAGRFLIGCFPVYLSRVPMLALAFALGVGACGVLFTFVALVGFLYQIVALPLMLVFLVVLYRQSRYTPWRAQLAVEADPASRPLVYRAHRRMALDWERRMRREARPRGLVERPLAWLMFGLLGLLTALTFFHAIFFPETYWDSLILYLGYARGIFFEHRFPEKVVLQVGVGLGANYPHLYELTGATIATWAGRWSPLYQQLAAPLAGLATMALIYNTVLRLSRSAAIALTATLLLRSVPHLLVYHTYASNYAFAVLYCAAFFYCALRYLEDGLRGYLILATLTAAFGMHVNYLMGVLWICWVVLVVVAHWPRRLPEGASSLPGALESPSMPRGCRVSKWPTLRQAFAGRALWRIALWGVAISSIWYARNWIVTGNPVYAFFTNLFPGTRHFNPEVLASAEREWQAHGAGIGIYGETLRERLAGTWTFFVNDYDGRRVCWRWAPSVVGLVLPGVLVFLATMLFRFVLPGRAPGLDRRAWLPGVPARLGFVTLVFVAILFAYHYCLGAFYLYHLLGCFGAFGVFIYFALRHCSRLFLLLFMLWATFCACMPGLPMAMMGQKLKSTRLEALHNPGMDPKVFYQLRWGNLTGLWDRTNELCKGSGLLTHENRHLLFDPTIRLVHMDDWELQQVWGAPSPERLETLRALGVRYYLQVPFEADHAINASLGHREWIEDGTLEQIAEARDLEGRPHVLYRFHFPKTGRERALDLLSRYFKRDEEGVE